MGIKAIQLRKEIIRPVLQDVDMWGPAAENLVMGTAAQESHLGYYLRQVGGGPALGIFQMEPRTYKDVITHVVPRARQKYPGLRAYQFSDHPEDMIWNLKLATIMCRLQYWRFEEALPTYNNVWGLAAYWKNYYNTAKGKGTVKEFVHNYKITEV